MNSKTSEFFDVSLFTTSKNFDVVNSVTSKKFFFSSFSYLLSKRRRRKKKSNLFSKVFFLYIYIYIYVHACTMAFFLKKFISCFPPNIQCIQYITQLLKQFEITHVYNMIKIVIIYIYITN
jgi:hypothetical protein